MNCRLIYLNNQYVCEVCGYARNRPFQKECTMQTKEAPTLVEKAFNFAEALKNHVSDGLKKRTSEEIKDLLVICQGGRGSDGVLREKCEHFVNGSCNECGCPVKKDRKFFNKLAWRSEHCPVAKW
jgi:hypothetical protein